MNDWIQWCIVFGGHNSRGGWSWSMYTVPAFGGPNHGLVALVSGSASHPLRGWREATRRISRFPPLPLRSRLSLPSLSRALSLYLCAPVLGFASAMAGPDEDEDEVLAHFLESEILSSVPDQVRSCLPSVSFRLRVGCRARVGVRVCLWYWVGGRMNRSRTRRRRQGGRRSGRESRRRYRSKWGEAGLRRPGRSRAASSARYRPNSCTASSSSSPPR